MAKALSQEQLVLEYLKNHNGITSKEAYNELGITQLGTRIFNLRKQGNVIGNSREFGINRRGSKTHFDRYYLIMEA